MDLSIEDIITKFPGKVLPKIDCEPTYEVINELIQSLYANAASFPSTLGEGNMDMLGS